MAGFTSSGFTATGFTTDAGDVTSNIGTFIVFVPQKTNISFLSKKSNDLNI